MAETVFDRARAIQGSSLAMGPKFLALLLNQFCGENGECWPSHERLAAAMSCSARAIRNWQTDLEALGVVRTVPGGGRGTSNRYSLDLSRLPANPEPRSAFLQEESATNPEPRSAFSGAVQALNPERRSTKPGTSFQQTRNHVPPNRKEKDQERKESARTQFRKPSMEELEAFASESKLNFDAAAFFDHFESNGWRIGGRTAMKDWRAAVRNWVRRESQFSGGPRGSAGGPAGSTEALAAWDRLREGLRKFGAVQPAKIRAGFDETEWPRVWGALRAAGGWDAIGNRPEHSRGAFLAAFDGFTRKEHR